MFKPFIVGLSGTELLQTEIDFIKHHKPWGIILFKRNCETPHQLQSLTSKIKDVYGTEEVPILIDQEGGRVARLKGEGWRNYPPAAFFYDFYKKSPERALDLVRLNASLQASELRTMGVTVNCAPMVDVRSPTAHDIIGDRAFSEEAQEVALYGRAVMNGHIDQGIIPIIKHIPGHGRALADSHESLPVVKESWHDLQKDFIPFKALNDAPLAMTAHILYTALDEKNCATLSPEVIRHVIRGVIGFTGILMSDDVSMKALKGSFAEITKNILSAGCDLVLHCNGDMNEMNPIADALENFDHLLTYRTRTMWQDIFNNSSPRSSTDLAEEYAELSALLSKVSLA